jgi:predicted solute-binding protein
MSVEPTVSYVVGCVPYVNAKPLVTFFERLGDQSPVRVLYDVPSRLPALLDSGAAQAALVSSFEALRTPGRTLRRC